MTKQVVNILTFDIEDYYMVSAFECNVKMQDWSNYESRVVLNTRKLLFLLSQFNIKATFFILGWVAEKFPELVRDIHIQGHEIAAHGYSHRLVYNQSPDEFRADVKKTKRILEDIIQRPVIGYRAPSFSITQKSIWAVKILVEEGYKYDSSIFPIYHNRGGMPHAERFFHRISVNDSGIFEVPVSTVKLWGQNIPVCGGGYFRLFPYWFTQRAIYKINSEKHPAVIYIHPWELDHEQPKIKSNYLNEFRHYVNLKKTEAKLKKLLKDFVFSSISAKYEVLNKT